MENLIKALVGLAALAFVLAVVDSAFIAGKLFGIPGEAYSRASNNLALIAIGLAVAFRERASSG